VARQKSRQLTEAEQRLMDILWTLERGTVAEIADALPKKLDLAYNTVLTMMRILEDKGYVRHIKSKEGRAFIYRPIVSREQASRSALHHLLGRFFGNSAEALVLNLIESEALSEKERERIRTLLKGDES
jgi:BlaI family transcriptional regulator, penicillinase repressor